MSPRLSPPAASFIREHEVRIGDLRLRAGIDRPTEIEGWWLAVLWVVDDEGIVPCRLVAPPPARRRIPRTLAWDRSSRAACPASSWRTKNASSCASACRCRPMSPIDPWSAPLVVQLAVRWEPARAAAMTPSKLADVALAAFRRAVEAASRP